VYEVIVEPAAQREFKHLTPSPKQRITLAIDRLASAPRAGAKKLEGAKKNWRIRVGIYRILYTIDDDNMLVHIYRIRSRPTAYR